MNDDDLEFYNRVPMRRIDPLRDRIIELERQHGSLRAAARVLQIDPAYLLRLRDGQKTNPGATVLRKLKLKKVVAIVPIEERIP
jgi:AraC-like DNA-binding protein